MVEGPPPQPATPPTHPDASRVITPAPTSRLAIASLGTAAAGLVLPLLGIAAIVLGIAALRRIPKLEQEGRGLALAGIGIGIVGFLVTAVYGLMIYSIVAAVGQTQVMVQNTKLMSVRSQAVTFAQSNQGAYPRHIAELAMSSATNFPAWAFVTDADGTIMVGDVDLAQYVDDDDGRLALRAAIDATDLEAPFYQVGRVWLARLRGPTYDGDIVYCWTVDETSRNVYFVMDDGTLDVTPDAASWESQWAADAAARPRHGELPVEMPPVPSVLLP